MEPIKLTPAQLRAANAAIQKPFHCTICSKRVTARASSRRRTERYLSLQPMSSEVPVWCPQMEPGKLLLTVFCHDCGSKISDFCDDLRKRALVERAAGAP